MLRPFGEICAIAAGLRSKYKVTVPLAVSKVLTQQPEIDFRGNKFNAIWDRDVFDRDIRAPGDVSDSLKNPSDQHSSTNIMNALNDDCLRAIFEQDELAVSDLVALNNVCRRFKSFAKDTFKRKHHTSLTNIMLTDAPIWQWEQFLRTFSSTLQSIDVVMRWRNIDTILHLIDAHCANIEELKCLVTEPACNFVWRPLFARIDKLEVHMRGLVMFSDLFVPDGDSQVTKLTIQSISIQLAPIKLSQLVELELEFKRFVRPESAKEFFELNPQLKKLRLKLKTYYYATCPYFILLLLRHLPNLNHLTLVGNWKLDCEAKNLLDSLDIETIEIIT